jgi:hypothetical protein
MPAIETAAMAKVAGMARSYVPVCSTFITSKSLNRTIFAFRSLLHGA